MKIITLTLNPAFDIHCYSESFYPHRENICSVISREAGGKGINISRALASVGVESTAVALLGSENADEFSGMLTSDKINFIFIPYDGRIRENITLHENNKPETRISFQGSFCNNNILSGIRSAIGAVDTQTVITLTGSIPDGISSDDILSLLSEYKAIGAKIVIDSRSISFEKLIRFKPWLIKPNRSEAEKYTDIAIDTHEDAKAAAQKFISEGVENVLISLGADGMILAREDTVAYAHVPKTDVISTIGAGDSSIAGFIDAYITGADICGLLKRAAAFGTAACLSKGTQPPLLFDIDRIECEIEISF
ncbi:MAG: hypothetical protein E7617_03800 [Ruminococcaceae bacterium]|nr:hypothetical protein [Oscillospiraceae bacterium]